MLLVLLALGACNRIAEAPGVDVSTRSVDGACVATDELMLRFHIDDETCTTITVANDVTLGDGELVLERNMTIEGPPGRVTVQRASGSAHARIVQVASTANVTLRNLIVTGGSAIDWSSEEGWAYGGGIRNMGTLTLQNCLVSGNAADSGGGIANVGDPNGPQLAVLTIEDSTIADNFAYFEGGGIVSNYGDLTITRSTIDGNLVAYGASGHGGGLAVLFGAAAITDTVIAGNEASDWAGGLLNLEAAVTLARSTVSGNGAGVFGGGIVSATFVEGQHTTIVNGTISGNCAGTGCLTSGDVGTYDETVPTGGGGIVNAAGLVRILHGTVSGNHADVAGGGVFSAGDSDWSTSAVTEVRGSIVWGNTSGTGEADDLSASEVPVNEFVSLGYNLIGAAGVNVDLSIAFAEPGDQTGVDPLLGDLLPNAPGTTETHALLPGSPALDAGTCSDHDGVTVATDQRGVKRPQGEDCDIGAFELEAATTFHATGFYEPVGAPNSVFVPSGMAPTPGAETIWNVARGNSTIPLKFNLYAYDGGPEITSTEGIAFAQVLVACPSSSAGDDAVDFTTAGSTSLRYDTTAGQFVQNWKAPKVNRDTCYLVGVTFPDDSALYAFMRVRK